MGGNTATDYLRFSYSGKYELEKTNHAFIEQVIRPTGLTDPICTIKPTESQVDDVIHEAQVTIKKDFVF